MGTPCCQGGMTIGVGSTSEDLSFFSACSLASSTAPSRSAPYVYFAARSAAASSSVGPRNSAQQGPALDGVMDAFSIVTSVALQYGVPLVTFVEKFHEHALRAGRHDRRNGCPRGAVAGGLRVPAASRGLP